MKRFVFILFGIMIAVQTTATNYYYSGILRFTITDVQKQTVSVSRNPNVNCSLLEVKHQDLVIPEKIRIEGVVYTVTSIEDRAFYDCSSLVFVTIPNTIKRIGAGAFSGCSKLAAISIPEGVTQIGSSAFAFCNNLTSVNIPNGITIIEASTFLGCRKLTTIDIPNSVKIIGERAFRDCLKLESVTIPNSVTSIGEEAFSRCNVLSSIYIPESVKLIGIKAFGDECNPKIYCAAPSELPGWDHNWNNWSRVFWGAQLTSTEKPKEKPTVKPTPQISDIDVGIPVSNIKSNNTFAVIIANENYEEVADVPFAHNDGEIFKQYCAKTLGIPEKNIRLKENATLNNINSCISWLKQVIDAYNGKARVIFYYAGHGISDENGKTVYLLPTDGLGSDVSTGYKLDDLYNSLGNLPSQSVTIFLDACFSGANRNGEMLASARGVAIKAKSSAPTGNMVVFSAAQGDETAYPYNEQQHGMFTYYLLKKIKETYGDVTYKELGNYVIDNVRKQSIVVNNKSQTPAVVPSTIVGSNWEVWKLK